MKMGKRAYASGIIAALRTGEGKRWRHYEAQNLASRAGFRARAGITPGATVRRAHRRRKAAMPSVKVCYLFLSVVVCPCGSAVFSTKSAAVFMRRESDGALVILKANAGVNRCDDKLRRHAIMAMGRWCRRMRHGAQFIKLMASFARQQLRHFRLAARNVD